MALNIQNAAKMTQTMNDMMESVIISNLIIGVFSGKADVFMLNVETRIEDVVLVDNQNASSTRLTVKIANKSDFRLSGLTYSMTFEPMLNKEVSV